jgi:hypothetical protein
MVVGVLERHADPFGMKIKRGWKSQGMKIKKGMKTKRGCSTRGRPRLEARPEFLRRASNQVMCLSFHVTAKECSGSAVRFRHCPATVMRAPWFRE